MTVFKASTFFLMQQIDVYSFFKNKEKNLNDF